MNNTEKTLKNSTLSVIAQIATLLLTFINRRIFIIFLDIEYLGYQTLFSNVFSILSVAELGIGNIIAYQLYKEIVNNNEEEIGKLMYLFRWLYRIVASIVLIFGLIFYFFLPLFIKDAVADWSYLHLIYFLQLSSIFIGYFLSYRRTIYIAAQKEYKCIQVDLFVNIIVQVVQLIFLAIFKNYIIYLCFQLSTTIIANAIIAIKTNRDYPYLQKRYSITKEYVKSRNMFVEVKNFLVHQICYAVYASTDNIIISAFCGVRYVALYGSYSMIQRGVMQILFYKLLNPIQATIGNIVYSNRDKKELWDQFNVLDVFSFYFASYIGLGFLIFYQPIVQLWMGKEYLLSDSFVALFSLTIYLGAVFEIVYKYRTVFGDYAQDRNCMMASAIMNLAISIPGAILWGIPGIQFGTLVAFLPIAYGRIRFVIRGYFEQPIQKYIFKHILLTGIVVFEGVIIWLLCSKLEVSFAGLIIRFLLWLIIPFVINTVIYYKNEYFKEMLRYGRRVMIIIKNKVVKNNK